MTKDANKLAEKPKRKLKKLLMISTAGLILIAAGIGGGIFYAGGISGKDHATEDPNLPKLVERSELDSTEPDASSEGKDAPLKTGTITVKNDAAKVDPKKYAATYLPLDQSFTANLADGAGFVQVGLSIATYYDGKVITNVKQEMVPIRSAILMVLSEENVEILSTPQGKHGLQKKLTKAINTVLRDKHGFGGIDNVYFTNLVIQ